MEWVNHKIHSIVKLNERTVELLNWEQRRYEPLKKESTNWNNFWWRNFERLRPQCLHSGTIQFELMYRLSLKQPFFIFERDWTTVGQHLLFGAMMTPTNPLTRRSWKQITLRPGKLQKHANTARKRQKKSNERTTGKYCSKKQYQKVWAEIYSKEQSKAGQ